MCIWKVAKADRHCEFCSYYGSCEAHDSSLPIDVAGEMYFDIMSGIIGMDVSERRRQRPLVWARYIVFWQLILDGYSYGCVGKYMGFDHSTVFHGKKQVDRMLEIPKMYSNEYGIWLKFQKSIELCGKKSEIGGGSH